MDPVWKRKVLLDGVFVEGVENVFGDRELWT